MYRPPLELEITVEKTSTKLRRLIKTDGLIYLPAVFDALGARLVQSLGYKTVYNGGFITGGSKAVSEPLLTMDEQVRFSGEIAAAVNIPCVADAGAGFGEPLHVMRTVREFIRAGVAGIHLEDQLYPKRAHYHKYVAHAIDRSDFIDKIKFACIERDHIDPDFVIIARSDTCRFAGLDEAVERLNMAAEVGADMGMFFPTNQSELEQGPKRSRLPLVYVASWGNRDGRPLPSAKQLEDMGYKMCIDPNSYLLSAVHFAKKALQERLEIGTFTMMTPQECVDARQLVEDLIGLNEFYEIEEQTVEKKKWGKR